MWMKEGRDVVLRLQAAHEGRIEHDVLRDFEVITHPSTTQRSPTKEKEANQRSRGQGPEQTPSWRQDACRASLLRHEEGPPYRQGVRDDRQQGEGQDVCTCHNLFRALALSAVSGTRRDKGRMSVKGQGRNTVEPGRSHKGVRVGSM